MMNGEHQISDLTSFETLMSWFSSFFFCVVFWDLLYIGVCSPAVEEVSLGLCHILCHSKKNQEHLLCSWEFHIKSYIVRVLLTQYCKRKTTGYIRWNRPFVTGQCDIREKDRPVSL